MTAKRVAVVTGAARGIGAATVHELASQGWSVLAVDIAANDDTLPYSFASPAELDQVVAQASEQGNVHACVADVRDVDALESAVAEAVTRWGGVDAAIACAGAIGGGVEQWKLPLSQEKTIIDINLGGVLALARAAIPAMLQQPEPRSGRFLAVSSAAATSMMPMLAAYSAAKAGIHGAIRSLAAELGSSGITANAVSPGSTETPILDESARLYDLPDKFDFSQHHLIQRLIRPAEVAAVLAFLAGESSGAITGAVIPVDGGLST
ncbi:MAG: mycofactocin-coupled SDR family oxidoreductase [Acidimicrobiales bacterium]